jgi:phosphoribosylanthranilate isomerase
MNFIIKICGITNETDALIAVEAGANALGFNFYSGSPRCISMETARCIASRLPDSVLKVGVFVEPSAEELRRAIDYVPLDVVQLHGEHVPSAAHRTWRALPATQANPIESLAAEAILLDSHTPHHGGSGRTFDWKLATRFWQPVILAGGLDSGNVAEAIGIARPGGVDACSRLEIAPGIKDPIRVRSFIQAAKLAADSLSPDLRHTPAADVPYISS